MRPRRIEMQALGPFAGRETIDFTQLPDDALFLIHGSTGAGKTTVLDAICFALYGKTSGDERKPDEMRSHHAAPDCLTEVTLDFALGEDLYRVHRVPRQDRPKARGEGFTTQNAEADLLRIDAEGNEVESLASGSEKVTAAIVERLQFKAEQFRQVVVLPQGRFRDLLAARSDDRQKILETLFQTDRYKRVEEALKRTAADLRRQVEVKSQRIEALSDEAATVLRLEPDAPRTVAALKRAWLTLDERLRTTGDLEQSARKAAAAARDALEEGRARAKRLAELREAGAALVALEQQTPDIEARRQAAAGARRAANLVPLADELRRAEKDRVEAEAARATSEEQVTEARAAAQSAADTLTALASEEAAAERKTAVTRVTQLEGLRESVAALTEAARAEKDAHADEAARSRALASAETAAEEAKRAAERAQGAHATAREAAAPAAEAKAALARMQTRLERRSELELALRATAAAEAAAGAARRQAQKAATDLETTRRALGLARQQHRDARAALLAETLEENSPCPVCGSTTHPHPARADGDAPDDAALELLEGQERERAAGARTRTDEAGRLEAKHAAAAAHQAGLARELGEAATQSLNTVEEALGIARAAHAQAEAARSALVQRAEAEQAAQARLTQAESARDEARVELADARVRHGAAIKAHGLHAEQVDASLRATGALEAAISTAQTAAKRLHDQFEQARTNAERTRTSAEVAAKDRDGKRSGAKTAAAECAKRATAFEQGLRDHGFESRAAWESARQDAAAVEAAEQAVTRHEKTLAAARDRHRRAEAQARSLEAPDLEALQASAKGSEAAERSALDLKSRLDNESKQVLRLRTEIDGLIAQRTALEGRYGVLGRLAAVAQGRNASGLSFQRFVLASRLEEVLDVASVRLATMTAGRYRLLRRTGLEDLRRAGGLDIDVEDNETGTVRPAHTLSGGEGFLAALALSLATADVVQRHAGGIRMDAIFVDEGFGSLDDEALDRAIRTLMSLHEGGRLVGVISHVPELRNRIDARLEVLRGEVGSHARFVLP